MLQHRASPAALAAWGLSLRPEEAADRSALQDLYIRHRWHEFAPLPWPDAQKRALLAQQFEMQHRQYREGQPHLLVLAGAEGIAGRLYFTETERDIFVVDILLDAPLRGQGIGGALLRALAELALRDGRGVSLRVEKHNPAQALYRRFDFVEVEDLGHAWRMRRSPEARDRDK
jgi:GNAT superfamily N-acetyltransferase